jgi:hypothetical protein
VLQFRTAGREEKGLAHLVVLLAVKVPNEDLGTGMLRRCLCCRVAAPPSAARPPPGRHAARTPRHLCRRVVAPPPLFGGCSAPRMDAAWAPWTPARGYLDVQGLAGRNRVLGLAASWGRGEAGLAASWGSFFFPRRKPRAVRGQSGSGPISCAVMITIEAF